MRRTLISGLLISAVLGAGGMLYKIGTLNQEIQDLTNKISSLKSANKKMAADHDAKKKNNKQKMKKHRKALIAKKLNRAKLKIVKAPASMVPVAGATAVIAFTANDIHNYCQDVKDFKELERSLFGSSNDELSDDEKILCGYDIEKELLPSIKNLL